MSSSGGYARGIHIICGAAFLRAARGGQRLRDRARACVYIRGGKLGDEL